LIHHLTLIIELLNIIQYIDIKLTINTNNMLSISIMYYILCITYMFLILLMVVVIQFNM